MMALDPDGDEKLIPITEQEAVSIVQAGLMLKVKFGPGWMALTWKPGDAMPAAVRHVGLLRGVINENMSGAGI